MSLSPFDASPRKNRWSLPSLWLLPVLMLLSPESWAERRIAVLVTGTTDINGQNPLDYVQNDAARLAETLEKKGGFKHEDILSFPDKTTDEIFLALNRIAPKTKADKENTLLLFYYSGHAGAQDLHLKGTSLSYKDLYEQLRNFPAALKLGLIDACNSGNMIRKGKPDSTALRIEGADHPYGRLVVFTSSRGNQSSGEYSDLNGSVFSYYLVNGLRGKADKDGNGKVNLSEAYEYASRETAEYAKKNNEGDKKLQEPQWVHIALEEKPSDSLELLKPLILSTGVSEKTDYVYKGRPQAWLAAKVQPQP